MVKNWRTEAKSIVVYLDDGLGAAADMNKAKIASLQVYADLPESGFLPNEAKCVWEPTQVITWLGAILNTSTSEISATDKRITSLQEDLAALLAISSSCHPVRKLASVCGKIISPGSCVGDVSRLMSRNLFAVINTAPTWNSYVRLSSGNLMLQILTAYLFGLSGASLRRSSILMLLAQLAAVSSSLRARCSIKTGPILKKLKVLHSENC